jgi:hypothetical protein
MLCTVGIGLAGHQTNQRPVPVRESEGINYCSYMETWWEEWFPRRCLCRKEVRRRKFVHWRAEVVAGSSLGIYRVGKLQLVKTLCHSLHADRAFCQWEMAIKVDGLTAGVFGQPSRLAPAITLRPPTHTLTRRRTSSSSHATTVSPRSW